MIQRSTKVSPAWLTATRAICFNPRYSIVIQLAPQQVWFDRRDIFAKLSNHPRR